MANLLKNIFDTLKKRVSERTQKSTSSSWYSDRYQMVTVQRNLALLIIVISISGIVLSIFTILRISSNKSIEPFIIEIEEKTGISTVIRPFMQDKWTSDESLRRYFLLKYIHAREGYDYNTFNYDYFTTVRLMSQEDVYSQFRSQIYATGSKSSISLGEHAKINIKLRSLTNLVRPPNETGYLAQVVFIKETVKKGGTTSEIKQALIGYEYTDLKMSVEDRDVNPLGFRVTSYKLDDYAL
jgi:type IV secretion system protein VirB8